MHNMKHNIVRFIDKVFNLKMEDSEQAVVEVKEKTNKKIKETRKTLKKAGNLQQEIMQKTTTYYLGKAAGVIK